MPKSIISEGKTSTEAIEKGLKELNCKKDDVEIKVLEEENKKAFFSILDPRVVKVELTLKENISKPRVQTEKKQASAEEIEEFKNKISKFLKDFCEKFEDIDYNINDKEGFVQVEIQGENASKLIGYRGEVINSLQLLISTIGNTNIESKIKVTLDIGNYREKRDETLKKLASKLERTVKKTGKKVTLEPMTAYERKVIHSELQQSKYVTTYSIGEEPHRRIVIDKK